MLPIFISLFVLCCGYTSADEGSDDFDLANFQGMPSGIVGNHVNVLTGDFIDYEVDASLPGPEPFVIDRVYSSSAAKDEAIGWGWNLNHNYKAYYRKPIPRPPGSHIKEERCDGRHNLFVSDGRGSYLIHLGEHQDSRCDGKYRTEEKTWAASGITNLSPKGLSGRSNVNNNEAWINRSGGSIKLSNGDVIKYRPVDPTGHYIGFLPIWKSQQNGLKETYSFNNDKKITEIRLLGNEEIEFSRCTFNYPVKDHQRNSIEVTTSTHPIHYELDRIQKEPTSKYILHKVKRPYAPTVSYEYATYSEKKQERLRLIKKRYPEERYVQPAYYDIGSNSVHGNKIKVSSSSKKTAFNRVKKIFKPLGETAAPEPEYKFIYNVRDVDSEKNLLSGSTDVIDALGGKRTYCYASNRLEGILSYKGRQDRDGKGTVYAPYKAERYLFGSKGSDLHEGYYSGTLFVDCTSTKNPELEPEKIILSGTPLLGRFVEYDSFGNVIQETLAGTLTGESEKKVFLSGVRLYTGSNLTDCYSKKMSYTQDGSNLLLEEWDSRKKIIYRYVPGKNLVSARLLSDGEKIRKREFFFYDDNGVKLKNISDDGGSENPEVLTGVSERLITEYKPRTSFPFGLHEEVIYKAYDPSTGTEKQLKRLKNSHSPEGWLLESEIYDAEDNYVASKKYRYNKYGKIIYEELPGGIIIERSYDKNTNLIEERGPLAGYSKLYTYDFMNRLIKEVEVLAADGISLVKSYRYNKKGERYEETDFAGNVTEYAFDEMGREVQATLPALFTDGVLCRPIISVEYDVLDNPIIKTDVFGNATKTKFTGRKKPYHIEHPDGTTEKFLYELDGILKESTDKYGNHTVFSTDYQGRVVKKELYNAQGELLKTSSYKYSATHLIEETDPLGCKKTYDYDWAGRLIRKCVGPSVSEYSYDSLSRLAREVTWSSAQDAIVKELSYDVAGRVTEECVKSLSGHIESRVRFEYNALGKKTLEAHLSGGEETITRYAYNGRGDLIETINPLGLSTRIEYQFNHVNEQGERGTCVTSIDPKGIITVVEKNSLGLDSRIEKKNSLGETIQLAKIFYNAKGGREKRVDTVFSENRALRTVITAWRYDSLGRLEHVIEAFGSPDEKTTSVTYNALGQRDCISKPSGVKILFDYDELGKLRRWWSSDSSFDYCYSYDAMDNPVFVEDRIFETATRKSYDIKSRLIEETLGNGYTVRYAYDLADRVTEFTYPDGSSVAYGYEGSRLKEVKRTNYRFEALSHDWRGKLTKGRLPLNGGEITCTYDVMGRVTNILSNEWKENSASYDEAGNMLGRIIEDSFGLLQEDFRYDDLNQLTSESGASSHLYAYDSLNNRIVEDGNNNTVNDLNQTLERKDRNYVYDADGNLIEVIKPEKTLRFRYDGAGRLIEFSDGENTTHYRYDETNRRISKQTEGKKEIRFIYQGQNELGTHDEEGEIRILGGTAQGAEIGSSIAIEKEGKVLCPVHDHNGNICCLIDAETGSTAATYRYSAFGEPIHAEGTSISWGFSSKRKDAESGLIFFGRRYYDPESGRFISKDPLGDRDGPNLYAYVANNPLMYVDLWGLFSTRHDRTCSGDREGRSWLDRGMDFVRDCFSFAGECIESFATHCLPASPFQYAFEGAGRVLQGKEFHHEYVRSDPIGHGTVGTREIPGKVRVATTGMNANDPNAQILAHSASQAMDGAKWEWFCSRSKGFLSDGLVAVHEMVGIETTAVKEFANYLMEKYTAMKQAGYSSPVIEILCHSRGGLETYRALKLLPAEIRACVSVYTIGSAYAVPKGDLRSAVNYVNPRDIVPKITSPFCAGNGAEVVSTGWESDNFFGMITDHFVTSEGYQQAIKDISERITQGKY
ncbi:RHS repeat-associated core domain-containing protein [Estrella lausannensis]|uniref:Rhs family protein n=1 Tax=Estrella lausannensis TaxID=483423 RepID=A0A0H5DN69_9BACT|nr:RHS repeat-associated core domain-containing protein [Estrella lausannensis]CRX37706.1 rhs family protein [Estrella lausannensis]